MKRAMAECDSVSVDKLAKAALAGADALRDYLLGTVYACLLYTSPWLSLDVPMTYTGTKKVAMLLGTMAADTTLSLIHI